MLLLSKEGSCLNVSTWQLRCEATSRSRAAQSVQPSLMDSELIIFVDVVSIASLIQMLIKDSSQRLPLHKMLEHPWIVPNAEPSGIYRGRGTDFFLFVLILEARLRSNHSLEVW